MGRRRIDVDELRFLWNHGWSRKELAEHFDVHVNSVDYNIRLMEMARGTSAFDNLNATIVETKKRIEKLLHHYHPCELTWEENVVELLWGLKRLVSLKRRLGHKS